ncbi:uncharacterized protein ColSpa_12441 [Colletotrichum spaethianum]|uniref:Uncharacterized protein n=1 Tax=Colletotrichum spaethianum TaxID=700344 RepID=A0AA37UQD0_9PEZI|nr:uncharacterized protein ColSpa_12441 [Colletotrichum spaethianum]GKT52260.1 hypothetical protein ColSpa_12441 [Colletotrichum spaethianum]
MPSSSTAAVRGSDHKTPVEKPTTPPLAPTRVSERPAIPVPSDLGYSIGRFAQSPNPSDRYNRPPLFASATPPLSPESAEAIGRARMEEMLAGILPPSSN